MARESSSFPHPLYEAYVLKPFFRDAKTYYYRPMLAANRAHAVMLYRCGIITRANAAALLEALERVDAEGSDALAYRSGVEDLFFALENRLIEIRRRGIRRQLAAGAQPQRPGLCADSPGVATATSASS